MKNSRHRIVQPNQEECLELLELVRQGGVAGKRARDHLVLGFEGLVRGVVSKFLKFHDERFEDFIQEGFAALILAIDRYDSARGAALSSFAWCYVEGAVMDTLNKDELVRLPLRIRKKAARVYRVAERLRQSFEREPSVAEIAEASGEPAGQIALLLNHWVHRDNPVSHDGGASTLLSLMPDLTAPNPERQAETDEVVTLVREAVDSLPPRKREIVSRFYGLGRECESGAEIGRTEGMARQSVRYIALSGVASLRDRVSPGF